MFKEHSFHLRVLTTLILVPLVLLALYRAQPIWLEGFLGLSLAIAAWEWTALVPLKSVWSRLVFLGAVGLLTLVAIQYTLPWATVSLGLWLALFFAVIHFPASQRWWGHRWCVIAMAFLLLPLLASLLVALYQHAQGRDLILYCFCLIWLVDSGAYLVGKQWGKHRLIPNVSPGKTIEGLFGGVISAIGVAVVGFFYFKPTVWYVWFLTALLTIVLAMLGDLMMSMLKRRCQLKDTGQLFPGHGGLLDRIDSLIAALPGFYLGVYLFYPGF